MLRIKSLLIIFSMSFFLVLAGPATAQVYFYLQPKEAVGKAEKSGFNFSKEERAAGDSLQLVFYKSTDVKNKLTCYFNPAGYCYQFSYTLPASSVVTFHKNLSTNFTLRDNGLWESREKNFLLKVEQFAGVTTVIYLPYSAP